MVVCRIASAAKADEIVHPVDEHGGLSAAGTGQHQHRSLRRGDGSQLLGIQTGKLPRNEAAAHGKKSFFGIVQRHGNPLGNMVYFR